MKLQELIDMAAEKNVDPADVEVLIDRDASQAFGYEPYVDVKDQDFGGGEDSVTLILSPGNAFVVLDYDDDDDDDEENGS